MPWAPKIFVYWKEFNEAPALQAFDVRTCKDARWYDVEITLATELADCYETKNPNEADFFLIAHRGTCLAHAWLRTNYSVPIGWYFNNVSEGYMLPMLEKIRTRYPYFNRTSGRDHIIIGSHDEGIAQFGPALRRRLQRTIRLQLVGLDSPAWVAQNNDAIDRAKVDIVVPTRNVDEADPSLQCEKNGNACFFGTVHKNVQYSHGVRQSLKAVGEAAYPGLVVDGHVATYAASMCACKFALCPSGYLPWSPRLVDAIILGTVPVIIADNIRVPFHRWIDYTKFSVKAHDATVRD
ncbi:exostosin family protein, partial [archaeon]